MNSCSALTRRRKVMAYISQGVLKTSNETYKIRRLDLADIPKMQHVQQQAESVLEDKSSLQPLSNNEFSYILQGNGLMIGAFVKESLIAFRALLVPPVDEFHLGYALDLKDQLENIIYQEISVVHPAYRGNQLQQKLAYAIMRELDESSFEFRYVCATVAPRNIPSLKDKFYQGMVVGALQEMYAGKMRYIFVKDLQEKEKQYQLETKVLPTSEIGLQQQLLKEGWQGIQLIQDGHQYSVKYAKRKH